MAKFLGLLLVVVVAAVAAFYFLVLRPQQGALAAAEQSATVCGQQLASLRTQLADLTIIRDQLQRSGAELAQKVAEKEKELAALHSTQDEIVAELKSEIADKTVQVERIRDQLRVDMVDEVLFDSGEATLKPAGATVLGKLASVLARTEDRRIEVQGHTDNVPITGALAKRFPTNWELSAVRATNVVRYLQEQAPGVAMDAGENVAMGITVDVPFARFSNCVEVRDTNLLDPGGGGDQKIYCPGVGLVRDEFLRLHDWSESP